MVHEPWFSLKTMLLGSLSNSMRSSMSSWTDLLQGLSESRVVSTITKLTRLDWHDNIQSKKLYNR